MIAGGIVIGFLSMLMSITTFVIRFKKSRLTVEILDRAIKNQTANEIARGLNKSRAE
jgi:hypothetical protein